ncbi:AraC family transcriptional regulator [Cellulomonas chitinilytica]|uniref:AraC family transcriptional regulator n=1 Tax=Cellulomonas chitinilytica TaxID=398759 RepID=A0A919TYI6_9CELL|nr:AraC family transcriptional regulator [Cellulomonas chitinilytica]GIG19748.1 AraC family transcriptional regulator [Cellulomonas chitinilytica]
MSQLVADPPWTPVDPVGEALHRLRITGFFYCRTEADGDWAVEMPAFADCVSFHVVTAGEAWVEVDGYPPVHLGVGDLALVPHGRGHLLLSAPGTPSLGRVDELPQEYVSAHYSVLRHHGPGPRTELVCGVLGVDGPASRPLLELLPPVVHIDRSAPDAPSWIDSTLTLMADELRRARPGGEAVTTRLADILVIQAVRAWLDAQESRTGWLGALRDPQVGAAIAAVHRDPGRPWTVEALARQAAMSRSSFAARFTQVVGEPAMRYVTRWRMHVAADRLAHGGATVREVAAELGYESEAAFSHAYTRTVGVRPGRTRRSGPGT